MLQLFGGRQGKVDVKDHCVADPARATQIFRHPLTPDGVALALGNLHGFFEQVNGVLGCVLRRRWFPGHDVWFLDILRLGGGRSLCQNRGQTGSRAFAKGRNFINFSGGSGMWQTSSGQLHNS